MSHPVLFGIKTLDLVAPVINIRTDDALNIEGGDLVMPDVFGNVVVGGQMVLISPTGELGSQPIPADAGVTTMTPFGNAPNANGATISGVNLTLQPCDATFPGGISTLAQDIPGEKTFVATQTNVSGVLISGVSDNTIVGNNAINTTLTGIQNVLVGENAGRDMTTGQDNVCEGTSAGLRITTGNQNLCQGSIAGAFITTGNNNVCEGYLSGGGLSGGSDNLILGANAGQNYAGGESNNILIKNLGVAADSGVCRIGTAGTHTVCHLAGDVSIATGETYQINQIPVVTETGATIQIGSFGTHSLVQSSGSVNIIAGTTYQINNTPVLEVRNTSTVNVGPGAGDPGTGSGIGNTCVGFNAGAALTTGANSTLIGRQAGSSLTTGGSHTCVGQFAGSNMTTVSGNVCIGSAAGSGITTNASNTVVGDNSVNGASNPSFAIVVGRASGTAWTAGTETNNLIIGNGVAGTAAETGVIRIGDANHTTCQIRGISGATSALGVAVLINPSHVLGTILSSLKYKENIQPVVDSQRVLDLDCMSFTMKNTGEYRYGFIAEQAQKLIPECVICETARDVDGKEVVDEKGQAVLTNDPKTIAYELLWPLLQNEVKKLRREVDELKAQLRS